MLLLLVKTQNTLYLTLPCPIDHILPRKLLSLLPFPQSILFFRGNSTLYYSCPKIKLKIWVDCICVYFYAPATTPNSSDLESQICQSKEGINWFKLYFYVLIFILSSVTNSKAVLDKIRGWEDSKLRWNTLFSRKSECS